jgi:hypothetical protein
VLKVALVGTIEIALGRRDRLISSLPAHKARCLKDEPGTLQMEVLAPREDDKCWCAKSIGTMPHSKCIGAESPSPSGGKKRRD